MENEKIPPSGDALWEMLREFVKDKDITFVTPRAVDVTQREIDSIPNFPGMTSIKEIADGLFGLPSLEEIIATMQTPDGGLRRGEIMMFTTSGRYPPDPMSMYRLVKPLDDNYKLDHIFADEVPLNKLVLEDSDLYQAKPRTKVEDNTVREVCQDIVNEGKKAMTGHRGDLYCFVPFEHALEVEFLSPEKSKELMEKYGGPARKHSNKKD